MKSAYHYIEYIERKGADLCRQVLTRAYVFLAIDIIIFIAHASFLSIDMGALGVASGDPSFLHVTAHLLSLVLIIACLFFQVYLYNAITSCTNISNLRTTFIQMANHMDASDEVAIAKVAQEAITQDMLDIEDATKKAARLLDLIEYFTCGACCLLFLIPI